MRAAAETRSVVRRLYLAFLALNTIAFLLMFVMNIERLQDVTLSFGVFSPDGNDTVEFTLYEIFQTVALIVLGIVAIGMLASLFGGGSAIEPIVRLVGMMFLYTVLTLGVVYFFSVYPPASSIYMMVSETVMGLEIVTSYSLGGGSDD